METKQAAPLGPFSLQSVSFFLSILTSSHLLKELEKMKEEIGPKHGEEEVQIEKPVSYDLFQDKQPSKRNLFQAPKKDPELLSTPVKAPASSVPSALCPSGHQGQYNSPVGLYSPETLREMMLMQGKLREGAAAARGVSSLG